MSSPHQVDPNMLNQPAGDGLEWRDLREFSIEGRGWDVTQSFYDRLPARARGIVPDSVWGLAQHSAGIAARFATDATAISARWRLRFESLAMWHMPSTGVSGIDLYAMHEGAWRWAGVSRDIKWPLSDAVLARNMSPQLRQFIAYLPLYNGVEQVEIGVPKGSVLRPADARPSSGRQPLCFYGTSIVQGGCASRPGMAYPAILGRRFDCPTINLGFSGSGKMEPAVSDLLAELDPKAYVIDCLPNMPLETIETNVAYLIRRLRDTHPRTPIVFVGNIVYANSPFVPSNLDTYRRKNTAQKQVVDRFIGSGVTGLHYVPCDNLIGTDGEGTVDGTHPTDLGFERLADVIEPFLRPLIS